MFASCYKYKIEAMGKPALFLLAFVAKGRNNLMETSDRKRIDLHL